MMFGFVLVASTRSQADDAPPPAQSRSWEAETLDVSFASPGVTRVEQEMSEQGPGWSHDKQLDIQFQQVGDALELKVPAVAGRPVRIVLMVSKSPVGGVVEIHLRQFRHVRNSHLTVRTSADRVSPPTPVDLGIRWPTGDSIPIRMILANSVSETEPLCTHFGLDSIIVEPYDQATERSIAEYLLDNHNFVSIERMNAPGPFGRATSITHLRNKSELPSDDWILTGVILSSRGNPEESLKKLSLSSSLRDLNIMPLVGAISAEAASDLAKIKTLSKLTLNGRFSDPELLKALSGHRSLSELSFYGKSLTDKEIEYLAKIPMLETLAFNADSLTDSGIQSLSKCSQLRFLLANDVTEQGVEKIASLSQLQTLSLTSRQSVSDQFLVPLERLPNLNQLFVHCAKMTDEGCLKLEKLKTLRSLSLTTAAVTPEAIERLKRQLPECRITSVVSNVR